MYSNTFVKKKLKELQSRGLEYVLIQFGDNVEHGKIHFDKISIGEYVIEIPVGDRIGEFVFSTSGDPLVSAWGGRTILMTKKQYIKFLMSC